MLINHLKSHICLFLAFSELSIWMPRVIALISYGFLPSLWIFLRGILQKLASFLFIGLF